MSPPPASSRRSALRIADDFVDRHLPSLRRELPGQGLFSDLVLANPAFRDQLRPNLGFALEQVVAMATVNPARVIGRMPKLGTLQAGAPGDVSILARCVEKVTPQLGPGSF